MVQTTTREIFLRSDQRGLNTDKGPGPSPKWGMDDSFIAVLFKSDRAEQGFT